ncbi:hypothetical protein K439DRAFT_1612277 [Ramaria rubella]|nr:hypothetical protein K439DRAFT_1612277 [Ramaria rubella]
MSFLWDRDREQSTSGGWRWTVIEPDPSQRAPETLSGDENRTLHATKSSWFKKLTSRERILTASDTSQHIPQHSSAPLSSSGTNPLSLNSDPSSSGLAHSVTTLNVLKVVLQALSAISGNIPIPGLNLPFSSLLIVINKVQATSQNAQGFRDLANRLCDLQPTLLKICAIGETNKSSIPSLVTLEKELGSLRNGIQCALSAGRLDRFINSTEDMSSLASHNSRLDAIIARLANELDVSIYTNQQVAEVHAEVTHVHTGVAGVQRGVERVESALKRRDDPPRGGLTQTFYGTKINTSIPHDVRNGGNIGSGNRGLRSQNFNLADFTTGGGNVGCNNTASDYKVFEMGADSSLGTLVATLLRLANMSQFLIHIQSSVSHPATVSSWSVNGELTIPHQTCLSFASFAKNEDEEKEEGRGSSFM